MPFALCSDVSCFGTHLAHNFLNNRCSVTILYNKEREMNAEFRNWEAKILHNAFLHKLHKVVHNDGLLPTVFLIMHILSICCKLSEPAMHYLLAHHVRSIDLAQRYAVCIRQVE